MHSAPQRTFRVGRQLLLALLLLPPGAALSREYQAIRGESTLAYTLVHPMHKVKGVTRDFVCKVVLAPDTVSSRVYVSAQVRSFDSGNSSRDSHAMEAVQALRYPLVEFASDAVKPEGDGYRVSGHLTFHGITRPVDFHVTPRDFAGKVEITGRFDIKLSDFRVKRPSLLFIPSEDKLGIDFVLRAEK
jgi:polyisoprenoid-binding protein YceI